MTVKSFVNSQCLTSRGSRRSRRSLGGLLDRKNLLPWVEAVCLGGQMYQVWCQRAGFHTNSPRLYEQSSKTYENHTMPFSQWKVGHKEPIRAREQHVYRYENVIRLTWILIPVVFLILSPYKSYVTSRGFGSLTCTRETLEISGILTQKIDFSFGVKKMAIVHNF